jgi:uncharacterized protein
MRRVFVDTAAWIALLNRDDRLHTRALERRKELFRKGVLLVTTEFVLLEVADALCAPPYRERVVTFIRSLYTESSIEILPVTSGLVEEGLNLFSHRNDKGWSLTDCISFVVMEKGRIVEAFTSDHQFEQAGFQKLL